MTMGVVNDPDSTYWPQNFAGAREMGCGVTFMKRDNRCILNWKATDDELYFNDSNAGRDLADNRQDIQAAFIIWPDGPHVVPAGELAALPEDIDAVMGYITINYVLELYHPVPGQNIVAMPMSHFEEKLVRTALKLLRGSSKKRIQTAEQMPPANSNPFKSAVLEQIEGNGFSILSVDEPQPSKGSLKK